MHEIGGSDRGRFRLYARKLKPWSSHPCPGMHDVLKFFPYTHGQEEQLPSPIKRIFYMTSESMEVSNPIVFSANPAVLKSIRSVCFHKRCQSMSHPCQCPYDWQFSSFFNLDLQLRLTPSSTGWDRSTLPLCRRWS